MECDFRFNDPAIPPCIEPPAYRVEYSRCEVCQDNSPLVFCGEHTARIREIERAWETLYCSADIHQDEDDPDHRESGPVRIIRVTALNGPQTPAEASA